MTCYHCRAMKKSCNRTLDDSLVQNVIRMHPSDRFARGKPVLHMKMTQPLILGTTSSARQGGGLDIEIPADLHT